MKPELFSQLVESVREMQQIRRGTLKPSRVTRRQSSSEAGEPDVAALRARFGLSQAKFAALLGISVDTLQNWEQGRRRPDGPARVLLRVAAASPQALLSVHEPVANRRKSR